MDWYFRFRNLGFSMIEVLISLVVLSLGVLGLAGLQLSSLRDNNKAWQRSHAIALVYEMADRMRANSTVLASGNYLWSGQPDDISVPESGTCVSNDCGAAEMADYDLYNWQQQLSSELAGGSGRVQCDPMPCNDQSLHEITVMWNDARVDTPTLDCRNDPQANHEDGSLCFSVTLLP